MTQFSSFISLGNISYLLASSIWLLGLTREIARFSIVFIFSSVKSSNNTLLSRARADINKSSRSLAFFYESWKASLIWLLLTRPPDFGDVRLFSPL